MSHVRWFVAECLALPPLLGFRCCASERVDCCVDWTAWRACGGRRVRWSWARPAGATWKTGRSAAPCVTTTSRRRVETRPLASCVSLRRRQTTTSRTAARFADLPTEYVIVVVRGPGVMTTPLVHPVPCSCCHSAAIRVSKRRLTDPAAAADCAVQLRQRNGRGGHRGRRQRHRPGQVTSW